MTIYFNYAHLNLNQSQLMLFPIDLTKPNLNQPDMRI